MKIGAQSVTTLASKLRMGMLCAGNWDMLQLVSYVYQFNIYIHVATCMFVPLNALIIFNPDVSFLMVNPLNALLVFNPLNAFLTLTHWMSSHCIKFYLYLSQALL